MRSLSNIIQFIIKDRHVPRNAMFAVFVMSLCIAITTETSAAVTEALSYQGKVVNSDGTNLTATQASCVSVSSADSCDFRARLYTAANGGILVWEDIIHDVEIFDNGGVFTVILDCDGDFSSCNRNDGPDFSEDIIYLQVEFDPSGDADFSEGEVFVPRSQLTASAYAFEANNTDFFDGLDSDAFLRSDVDAVFEAGNTLDIDGDISINGDTRISGAFYDKNNNSGTDGQVLASTGAGVEWIDMLGGSGSSPWTTDGSDIYKIDGSVGIGTAETDAKLTVAKSAGVLSSDAYGIHASVTRNHIFADTERVTGILGEAINTSIGALSGTVSMTGLHGRSTVNAIGATTGAVGVYADVQHAGIGALHNAYGLYTQVEQSGLGSITNAHGVYVANAFSPGLGNITSNYGIYIETPTAGSVNYPLYSQSGAHLSVGGTWVNASDKNLKENYIDVSGSDILKKLSELQIQRWNYISEDDDITHIGPTAQDFFSLFGLGSTDTSISTIDPASLALIGVQELNIRQQSLMLKIDNDRELANGVNERFHKNDTVIEALNTRLGDIDADFILTNESITQTQNKLTQIENENAVILDFFTALNPETILYTDADKNLTVTGDVEAQNIKARGIVAGAFTVKNIDGAQTLGTAIIKEGDKKTVVQTSAVSEQSRIFITPRIPVRIGVTDRAVDEGFTIAIDPAAESEVIIDWWVVESDDVMKASDNLAEEKSIVIAGEDRDRAEDQKEGEVINATTLEETEDVENDNGIQITTTE